MAHCTKSQGGTFFSGFSTACRLYRTPISNRRLSFATSRQGDVVADIVGGPCDAVIELARRPVVGLGVPVDPPPAALPATGDQGLDDLLPQADAASRWFDPEVFEITNHAAAERMRPKNVMRKAEQPAIASGPIADQSAYRMIGIHDPAP